jgi:hypothetical protein
MGMLVMMVSPLLQGRRARRPEKGRSADGRRAGSGATTVAKSIAQQQRAARRDTAADGDFTGHDAELTREKDNGKPADARQSAGAVSRRPLIPVVRMRLR